MGRIFNELNLPRYPQPLPRPPPRPRFEYPPLSVRNQRELYEIPNSKMNNQSIRTDNSNVHNPYLDNLHIHPGNIHIHLDNFHNHLDSHNHPFPNSFLSLSPDHDLDLGHMSLKEDIRCAKS